MAPHLEQIGVESLRELRGFDDERWPGIGAASVAGGQDGLVLDRHAISARHEPDLAGALSGRCVQASRDPQADRSPGTDRQKDAAHRWGGAPLVRRVGGHTVAVPIAIAPESAVFFHAHPDDEAIFTGGTMARLAADGVRVVVVIATGGELGAAALGGSSLADCRAAETRAACACLGVARVEFLGYGDSGLLGPGDAMPVGAFALAPVDEAADRLAAILVEESASTLVFYDEGGIYGHADHLAVHRVGRAAAGKVGDVTVYESTVDREYLHFVETHLVEFALASLFDVAPGAAAPAGVPTALVSTTIDVREVIDAKRSAMAAHLSQIPPGSPVLGLDSATFAGVYGYEWYVRSGPPGLLDALRM